MHGRGFSFKNLKGLTLRKIGRGLKLQYIKLLRTPGGGKVVATGFSIGFSVELILPITLYIGYLLLLPLFLFNKRAFSAAVIGNVICKVSFLPLLLIPFGRHVGKLITPVRDEDIPKSIFGYLQTLLGLSAIAILIGIISFVLVYFLYDANRKRRERKRKEKKRQN